MPGSDEIAGGRRYLLGLLLALAALVVVAAFNLIVDPLGLFGAARRHAFNRSTPMSVMYWLAESRDTSFYQRIVADPAVDTVLIGTSRTDLGFDTCGLPIGRVVGYGWGAREFGEVTLAALAGRTRAATLLIEVAIDNDPAAPPPRSSVSRWLYAAWSPLVTRLTWDTLVESVRHQGQPANCRRAGHYVPPAQRFRAGHDGLAGALAMPGSTGYRRSLARLSATVRAADRICGESGLRHRLVLFSLPLSHRRTVRLDRLSRRVAADVRQVLDARPSRHCEMSLADFSLSAPGGDAWQDPTAWWNESHFSPRLGNAALPALLSVQRAADRQRAR